jgi:LmbE family N-acetylglucosaminyl deacetylase
MTHWFFSPHPDDAALSCGGQIATLTAQGEKCVIITIMAGNPPPEFKPTPLVEELWTRWGIGQFADVSIARREEDQAAAAVLGAKIIHLNHPDAVYRSYYKDVSAIFGVPAMPDMLGLFNRLIEDLNNRKMGAIRESDTVHLPLGVGGHVDHLIVGALGVAFKTHKAVYYYEDYPYSRQPEKIEAVIKGRLKDQPLKRVIHPLTDSAVQAKINAVACYPSQISSFWSDPAAMETGLRNDLLAVGGEAEWHLQPPLERKP